MLWVNIFENIHFSTQSSILFHKHFSEHLWVLKNVISCGWTSRTLADFPALTSNTAYIFDSIFIDFLAYIFALPSPPVHPPPPPQKKTCWASLLFLIIPPVFKFFFDSILSFILQFVDIFSEHFRRGFSKFLDFLLDFREHYDNIVSGQHLPTPVWVYIFDSFYLCICDIS